MSAKDTSLDLEELERVAKEATPGPWYNVPAASLDHIFARAGARIGAMHIRGPEKLEADRGDAVFVATFDPPTVLRLISELKAAREERDELRLAICGGEDAPGYNASLSHETILGVLRDNYASWKRDSELAWDGETANTWKALAQAAEAALDRINRVASCGTVKAFLALPDEDKGRFFALALDDSERRKAAEAKADHLLSVQGELREALSEPVIERFAYEASVWAKDPAHNIGADQPSLVFARRFAFLLRQSCAALALAEGQP